MPDMAEGRMILKIVRSFPAPSAKLPSRKESGTAFNASSVVRMTSGRIISAIVSAPERTEVPQPNNCTKKSMPKMPYTMDGMPASVSAAMRTILTNTLLDFAYSTIKIAANTPSGTATASAVPAMNSVFKSAGSIDWFSVVYSHSNSLADRLGTPCTSV